MQFYRSIELTKEEKKDLWDFACAILELSHSDFSSKPAKEKYSLMQPLFNKAPRGIQNLLIQTPEAPNLTHYTFEEFCTSFTNQSSIPPKTKERFRLWRNELEERFKNSQKPENRGKTLVKPELDMSDSEFAKTFSETDWICYSRFDDSGQPKIGCSAVKFKSFDVKNEAEVILYHYLAEYGTYIGKAKLLRGDILVMTFEERDEYSDEKKQDYSHFLFRLYYKGKEETLSVGHVTFRHHRYLNVITKTAIITRNTDKIAPQTYEFNDPSLDEDVRSFFKNPMFNRLPIPQRIPVFNLKTLKDWMRLNAK